MKSPAEALRDLHMIRSQLNQTIAAAVDFCEDGRPEACAELVGFIPTLRELQWPLAAAIEAVLKERD